MRASFLFVLSALSLACSQPAPAGTEAAPPERGGAAGANAASTPPPVPPPAQAVPAARRAPRAAPMAGCVVELERALAPGERALALSDESVLLARSDGLSHWRLEGERWIEGARLPLSVPLARGTTLCTGSDCDVAFVDRNARLWHTRVTGALSAPRELARGVDRRFAPALARVGERLLVVYTVSVDEAMHIKLVSLHGGELGEAQDLTPAGHGAAAPAFVLGAPSPVLVAIDAHDGISPLLEIPFQGVKPQPALVRTPVSQPYAPPQVAAVHWKNGEIEAFYTAVGKLAMTAIGRVPLRHAQGPTALAPSRGYGELVFAVARGPQRALFAFEQPTTNTPKAPRALALAISDGTRTEEGPSFAAPLAAPSLARTQAGYLLTFTRDGQIRAALLRCAE